MLRYIFKWLKSKLFSKNLVVEPIKKEIQPVRRKVDTESIRTRIKVLGWNLREIPIKRNHPDAEQRKILQWKLTAVKKDKSIEVSGATIDDAMKNIGKVLGVIPN